MKMVRLETKRVIMTVFAAAIVIVGCGFSVKSTKVFVGYRNQNPVFDDFDNRTLVTLNGRESKTEPYNKEYYALKVENEVTVFDEDKKGGSFMVVSIKGAEKKYPLKQVSAFAAIEDSSVYFTDINDNDAIKVIRGGNVAPVGLKGYVVDVIGDHLYFSQTHDIRIVHANADIFVKKLTSKEKPRKLIENTGGEAIVISPDEKYLFDKKLIQGEFRPILLDMLTGKYKVFQEPKGKFSEVPYYSYQQKEFVFYNTETLETKPISEMVEINLR